MLVATVTIDHAKVDSDLTDFPIFIDLSDLGNTFWNTVKSGGGDIRVYKNDGTTQLAREVVSCDTTAKTGELHVKYTGTLSSTTDTTIQIWADGTSSEPTASSTYGSEAVWSDYRRVFHLGDTTSTILDSSGNSNATRSGTSDIAGKVGNGQDFNGTSDNVSIGNNAFTNAQLGTSSAQAWFKAGSLATGNNSNILAVEGAYELEANISDDSIPCFRPYDGSTGYRLDADSAVNIDTWYMIHATVSTSFYRFYINGSEQVDSGIVSTGIGVDGLNRGVYIGAAHTGSNHNFDGIIDEFRLCKNTLSSTWISTEYNNQNSPSTFYSASEPTPATNSSNFFQFF